MNTDTNTEASPCKYDVIKAEYDKHRAEDLAEHRARNEEMLRRKKEDERQKQCDAKLAADDTKALSKINSYDKYISMQTKYTDAIEYMLKKYGQCVFIQYGITIGSFDKKPYANCVILLKPNTSVINIHKKYTNAANVNTRYSDINHINKFLGLEHSALNQVLLTQDFDLVLDQLRQDKFIVRPDEEHIYNLQLRDDDYDGERACHVIQAYYVTL